MNELFVSVVSPEKVLSGKFRVHAVKGDEMEPKLRGGRDYVLAAPATSYEGEGLYLIDTGLGMELYQVTNILGPDGALMLSRENPAYCCRQIDRRRFNDFVVGIVVADVRVRDDRFLRS